MRWVCDVTTHAVDDDVTGQPFSWGLPPCCGKTKKYPPKVDPVCCFEIASNRPSCLAFRSGSVCVSPDLPFHRSLLTVCLQNRRAATVALCSNRNGKMHPAVPVPPFLLLKGGACVRQVWLPLHILLRCCKMGDAASGRGRLQAALLQTRALRLSDAKRLLLAQHRERPGSGHRRHCFSSFDGTHRG